MNNDLINELYSKIDNQEKIIVDLQKNNSGITLEEHVRVLNAYQELQKKYKKQKEVIDKTIEVIDKMTNSSYSIGFTQYCATGEDSEFGTRAKIIKDILKEVSK